MVGARGERSEQRSLGESVASEASPLIQSHSGGLRHPEKFKICLQPSEKCASHFGKKFP